MRPRLPGDDRGAPRPRERPADPAAALLGLAEGRDDGRPGARRRPAAAQPARRARRDGAPAAARAAVRPALGPEPLRRPEGDPARPRGHPRSGARRAPPAAGRGVEAFHRRRARAHAGGRLPARRRAADGEPRPAARPRQRAEALAGADLRARARARGLHAAVAVLPAMGGRQRAGRRRPRPAGHARPRLRPAGADPGRRRRDPLLGGAAPVDHAQPAVAVERVRAPDAAAGGVVREAPHRRRDVALRRGPEDPADADHQLHRGRARRPARRRHAGDDAGLQRPADGDRARAASSSTGCCAGPSSGRCARRPRKRSSSTPSARPTFSNRCAACSRSSSSTARRTARRAS